jgi:small-conductance mechanosensitive channel
VPTLPQTFIRIVVLALGLVMVLGVLGIPITPILTALGIGGLAVALALQDTLSNLFAGFYVTMGRQIRIGDYIQLDSGPEGFVADISWRTTTMRTTDNNLTIVPNAKLAQAVVTNFQLPEAITQVEVAIGVSYQSDPEQVERVLLDEAKRAVGEIPSLLGQPEPLVRFADFGDSALNFRLFCYVKDLSQRALVQHELRKRIFKRFQLEGIEIPFPARKVYLQSLNPTVDQDRSPKMG